MTPDNLAISTSSAVIDRRYSGLRVFLTALSTVAVMAAGCAVGPNYVRPAVDQPARFKSQPADNAAPLIAPEWWKLYNDPELDQLIASAQASNQTLRQAVAAVDQARALARVARSYLYPSVAFNLNVLRERLSANRVSTITGLKVPNGTTISDWLMPFDLTY